VLFLIIINIKKLDITLPPVFYCDEKKGKILVLLFIFVILVISLDFNDKNHQFMLELEKQTPQKFVRSTKVTLKRS